MKIFEDIYRGNLWNGVESRSGPGSNPIATDPTKAQILRLVDELGVKSVLDVGCGDGFWMPDLPGYVGIDPSPYAIRLARQRHPRRKYVVMDGADLDEHVTADLVICRDVIQHLSYVDGIRLLDAMFLVGTEWLLLSTYEGTENRNIVTGEYYSPDLTASPFDLGDPEELIPDGWSYHEPGVVRDPTKFLGLWRRK